MFNSSPDAGAESHNGELDQKLGSIFARYQREGKIVDGKISGSDYTKLQRDVEVAFPDVTASVFNPYLLNYRCIKIQGDDSGSQTAPWSTSKVVKNAPVSRPASAPSAARISFKNRSANDDTPDLLDN